MSEGKADQNGDICLRSSANHMWNEVPVTRRIQDCVEFVLSLEHASATLLCFAFGTLLICGVESPCEFPRFTIVLLGLPLILAERSIIELSSKISG